jgi:hypothetical protein
MTENIGGDQWQSVSKNKGHGFAQRLRSFLAALRRMPLRTRLVVALVILILSSASATIMIGNTVFGSKFDDLACDLVTLYARLASQVFEARLEKMRLVVRDIGARCVPGADALTLGRIAESEVSLDFILLRDSPNASLLLRFSSDDRGIPREPLLSTLTNDNAAGLSCKRTALAVQGPSYGRA